jgi:hypothetical protein
MSDEIIKIDTHVFKKGKEALKDMNPNQALLKKKQDIYSNNNCFHIAYNPEHNAHNAHNAHTHSSHGGHGPYTSHKNSKSSSNNQNRLYIITSDFTEDEKVKKQIIGHLNKLTENNKASIYQKIKDIIDNTTDPKLLNLLYESVWEFIKKSADQLYVSVLKYFETSVTAEYIENYIQNKGWYPPQYAFENNVICANTENDQSTYDMYCDYVKWKNGIANHNKAVVMCVKDKMLVGTEHVEQLSEDLYVLFEASVTKGTQHLTHFALEQIQMLVHVNKNRDIVHKLREVNLEQLDSLSRFLILGILEL